MICGWTTAAYAQEPTEETWFSQQREAGSPEFSATLCPAPSVNTADVSFGQELANFFPSLLDTQPWPARWQCGDWSPFLGWLYIASDFLIWVSYFAIPVILFFFVYRRNNDIPFRAIFFWFIAFILACGLTHLIDGAIFWWPAYRLSTFVRFVTAFVSLGTVFALTRVVPQVLELKSPETLDKLVQQRTAELQEANRQLAQEIAQREKAEEALRESEERLQKVVDNLSEGLVLSDESGHFLRWNQAALRMHGFASWEECYRQLPEFSQSFELYQSESDSANRAMTIEEWPLNRLFQQGSLSDMEVSVQHTQQQWNKVFCYNGNSITDSKGARLYFLTISDITEQKQAEEVLRESELRFRALIEASSQIVWTVEASGEVREDSPSWRKFTGQTYEEWKGYGWLQVIHPDDRDRVAAEWQTAHQREETLTTQYRLWHVDGEWRWTLVRAVPLRNPEIYGWVGMNTDITEQKQAELALQESESRLTQLIESLPQLVWTCQPDGPCDFFSKQWIDYTGIPEEEQLGYAWLEQLHPDDREATVAAWHQAVDNDEDFRVEFRIRRHDGVYRWFDTIASRLYDADGNLVKWFGSNTDIEEKKKAALEVRRLNGELEQRVKERTAQLEFANRELQSFSYSVSHDLRAPLRHVHGYSDMLLEGYQDRLGEEGNRILAIIKNRALKMGELIDDLLEFSRMARRDINHQLIDSTGLVKEVYQDSIALESERNIALTVHSLDDTKGDYSMIKQVWSNLISNAIKYTRDREKAVIEIGSYSEEGSICYFIKDNGTGFNMQYVDKLFNVFQRLHKDTEFEGTGVGLALVKRIVSRHGGNVWVEAQENEGATFYFTLPAVKEPSENVA